MYTLPCKHALFGGALTIEAAFGGFGAITCSSGPPWLLAGGLHYTIPRFFRDTTTLLNTYTSHRAGDTPRGRSAASSLLTLWRPGCARSVWPPTAEVGPRRPFRGGGGGPRAWMRSAHSWLTPHKLPAAALAAQGRRTLEPLTSWATPPVQGGDLLALPWGSTTLLSTPAPSCGTAVWPSTVDRWGHAACAGEGHGGVGWEGGGAVQRGVGAIASAQ